MSVADVLDAIAERSVLVVGDVMLDEYLWGSAQRISPEAPVPIVDVTRVTRSPGGAANAAANLRALGVSVRLLGVVGDDVEAAHLRSALERQSVSAAGLVVDPDRHTTTKVRLLAHQHQVARYDRETRAAVRGRPLSSLIEAAIGSIREVAACVVSDYGKGVVTAELCAAIISEARARDCPVVVDPKGRDFSLYRDATLVTPNVTEAELACGHEVRNGDDLHRVGRRLVDLTGADVLITRGADGMSLFSARSVHHIVAAARTVFDVTGAGDTVAAVAAATLAAGGSTEDAARLANVAAGIVVGKVGAATATREELEAESRRFGVQLGFVP